LDTDLRLPKENLLVEVLHVDITSDNTGIGKQGQRRKQPKLSKPSKSNKTAPSYRAKMGDLGGAKAAGLIVRQAGSTQPAKHCRVDRRAVSLERTSDNG
jgi:hypothetical protein